MQTVFSLQKEFIDQFKYKEVLPFMSMNLQEQLFMRKICDVQYRNTSQITTRYITVWLYLGKEATEHSAENLAGIDKIDDFLNLSPEGWGSAPKTTGDTYSAPIWTQIPWAAKIKDEV